MKNAFEKILTAAEKAALRGEIFANRVLVDLDLSGADLREARFDRTQLVRCNLSGADLRGARFVSCELRGVVLLEAVFGDNRFDGTTLEGAVGLAPQDRALLEQSGATFQPVHASRR